MSVTEPPVHATGEKGLQAGALGLVGNMVIGLASVAPAYSLAATLGLVVAAVGDKITIDVRADVHSDVARRLRLS